jgi:hypothetical protein
VFPVVLVIIASGAIIYVAVGDPTALEYAAKISLILVVIEIDFSWRNRKAPAAVINSYSRSKLSLILTKASLVLTGIAGFAGFALIWGGEWLDALPYVIVATLAALIGRLFLFHPIFSYPGWWRSPGLLPKDDELPGRKSNSRKHPKRPFRRPFRPPPFG